MFHVIVLVAEKKVTHKDAYFVKGGKARCNRGVSLFILASMKDSRATIKKELWREGAWVKEQARERSILEHAINNTQHHLSKNILMLTKAQYHQSHTSEVMEWHVMHPGVSTVKTESIPEDHLSFHNCCALYKNIFQFYLFNTNCFHIISSSDPKVIFKQ